jgi:uncharacterized membrane protein
MGWIEFAAALALFLGSHRIPALIGVKGPLTQALGPRGYTVMFSAVSTLLLAWVIVAAGRAPYIVLWDHALWHRWVVNIAMPLALGLIVFGIAAPNPFAFEGRSTGFDASRPGIAGLTRQPLLWGLALWAGAHLLANGDLAHGLMFGSFALFSVLGMGLAERRRARSMGAADWRRLTAHTGLVPFTALLTGRWRPAAMPPLGRSLLWLAAWSGLWLLHAPVIGVSPAP